MDVHGRQLLYRSDLSPAIARRLPEINADALEFMASVRRPFTEKVMQGNARGPHFFSIAGHDRESCDVRLTPVC